jgi:tetratricopeptide (TPR) repeat protein
VEARNAATELAREHDPKGEADALRLVGAAAISLGQYDEAVTALERALTIARTLGFAVIEAEALRTCAELAYARGDRSGAITLAQEALAILTRLGADVDARNLRDWIAALGG